MNTSEDIAQVLLIAVTSVIIGVLGAAFVVAKSPPEPPPLVCVEQSRTGHPQVPGVFAVTLVCRVDVEGQVLPEPLMEGLS